jgi:hypothetical protein
MERSFEAAAVEWSRSLGLFKGTPVVELLGEGADVLPIVFASALTWFVMQMLYLPICRIAAPSFVSAVETVAKGKAKGSVDIAIRDAHRDVGVRICALVFSTWLSYGAIRLNLDTPPQFVEDPHFSSSPYATFFCAVAAGYFVWDLPVCLIYGYGPGFLLHAVGCLFVELVALHPFNQVVMNFSHLFELSTPFMNFRILMISSGHTNSMLFSICEVCFCLSFLVVRIFYGYYKTYGFVARVATDLLSDQSQIAIRKGAAFVPIAWASCIMAVVLCMLNGFWLVKIVKMATGANKPKKKD